MELQNFGKCGNNATWSLENGVLTIVGSGAIYDYMDDEMPWYRQKVTKIVISEGIDEIGSGAFYHCKELEKVTLSQGLKKIGEHAFNGCPILKEINFPEGLEEIESYAFEHSELLTEVHLPSSVHKIGLGVFPENCVVVSDFLVSAKKQIAKAIETERNVLIESGIDKSIVKEVAIDFAWEMVEEAGMVTLSSYCTDDGGILIDGKKCLPKWAMPIIKNPDKKYVVFIDCLDYTNIPIYKWLESILHHVIAGQVVDNYVVVGHISGGSKNFDYEQLAALFNDGKSSTGI